MGKSKIDYLDYTINAIQGCSGDSCAVRAGCYARVFLKRFNVGCNDCKDFRVHFHPERLNEIGRIKKPSIIGLNFFGDTWDSKVNFQWRKEIWQRCLDAIETRDKHQFIVLTKQPQNIHNEIDGYRGMHYMPDNLWVGVTITCEADLHRWVALSQKTFIKHKFISFEPVLGLKFWLDFKRIFRIYGWPGWIIVGALTNVNKAAKFKSQYAALLLFDFLQALKAPCPIFIKSNCKLSWGIQQYPPELTAMKKG